MTESDWLKSTDPKAMLEVLRGKASDRKLRLFACACCRCIWHLLSDERSRRAVEVAEQAADGQAGKRARKRATSAAGRASDLARAAACEAARNGGNEAWAKMALSQGAGAAASVALLQGLEHAAAVAGCAAEAAKGEAKSNASYAEGASAWMQERAIQAAILRDISGPLPFRLPPIDPSWLRWNSGVVRRLAEEVYQERQLPAGLLDAVRLAVLADALEDAGCDDAVLLEHLRGPGPHVRGCWLVDHLTGRT
jgi:hypothetical protein